jgi:hypothetical protein
MDIPDIDIDNIQISNLNIPDIDVVDTPPLTNYLTPPVTVNIGVPIVDIPGCVEAHQVDENNKLEADDPKGVKVYCDGQTPSYNPIQYEPDQMVITRPSGFDTRMPDRPESPEVKSPEVPKTPASTAKIDCPTREQELTNPIGKVLEGNKKIVRYELVNDKCIEVTEKLDIPQQIISSLPSAGMVTTTASIAIVATSSALLAKPLADILLKVVKPTVKKVMKKIAAIRGKSVKVLSTAERRNEQRDRNRAIMAIRQTLKPK